jgi:hypothetical protein
VRYGPALAILASALGATSFTMAKENKPRVVVMPGDNVIPQVVDGGNWKTTFKFVNLENHFVSFRVSFLRDDGSPLLLPFLGSYTMAPGVYSSIFVELNTAESTTIETAGVSAGLAQGWALIDRTNMDDAIGGFAIFRQRVPGGQDQEATVPVVNQFSGHFVMLF